MNEHEQDRRRRVVVADDDAAVRMAIIDLLRDEPGIEVVGDAGDGSTTVRSCVLHRPDVLIVDVNMPEGGGERAAAELSKLMPTMVIIAISANADRVTRRKMAAAGATSFVAKGAIHELVPLVVGG